MLCEKTLLFSAIMGSFFSFGQGKNTEIGVVTDNDLYTSSKNDMYYTNGLEFFYRVLSGNENEKVNKKVTEFRIGQYIYNPKTINAEDIAVIDRPFAGYLFVEAGRSFFYQDESVIKIDAQIGFVGPNSFAKETQSYFHGVLGHRKARGWQHQIRNALALQTHFFYSKKLFLNQNQQLIDFCFQSEGNMGTALTGFSAGFLTRIGFKKLVPIYDSNLHGASVNGSSQAGINESEFYFYFAPSMNYQLYDATIQGSLFDDNSPVTYGLVPFRFNGESGLKYRKNNLNLSYSFIYRGKEVRNEGNMGYFYGSISISFLFK